jgi:hypothetical protein
MTSFKINAPRKTARELRGAYLRDTTMLCGRIETLRTALEEIVKAKSITSARWIAIETLEEDAP